MINTIKMILAIAAMIAVGVLCVIL